VLGKKLLGLGLGSEIEVSAALVAVASALMESAKLHYPCCDESVD